MSLAVDNHWSVTPNPASISVSTTSLPAGVTAWPGIGTANSVVGRTIQFASNDLTVGTTYGFFITSGIGGNPAGPHLSAYLWDIETFNGLSSIEQTAGIAVSVVQSSNIVLTASVLPQATDLSVTIAAVAPPVGDIEPETILSYEMTYENLYSSSSPLTVQASWSLGTLEGTSSPSIDILSYVSGSATDGYSATPPVIDTLARTITWTIASLPAGSGPQTVQFSLKTNSYASAGKLVSFTTSAAAVAPISSVPDEITQGYRAATPVATPSPTASSDQTAATPQPTATPAPAQLPLRIESVRIVSITDSTVTIAIGLSRPGTIDLTYQSSLTGNQTAIRALQPSNAHTITIPRLAKNTQYLIRFSASAADGQTAQSDYYSVTTASGPTTTDQLLANIRLTSQGVMIANLGNQPPTMTIPFGNPLEISLELASGVTPRTFTLNGYPFEQTVDNSYVARFTPSQQGTTQLSIVLFDANGALSTTPIAQLIMVNPLQIRDRAGGPVEFARVFIKKYNPETRLFEIIPAQSLIAQNPLQSNQLGNVPMILPHGRYQFEVSAPGFTSAVHTFELSGESLYPVIVLEHSTFPLIGRITNSIFVAHQMLALQLAHLRGSTASASLYATAAFLTCAFFLVLSSLSLAARIHVPFLQLPSYLWHRSRFFGNVTGGSTRLVRGKLVAAATHKPISRALITFMDESSGVVLASVTTDRSGSFQFRVRDSTSISGRVSAVGYAEGTLDFSAIEKEGPTIFELEEHPAAVQARAHRLLEVGETLLGSLFEVLLVVAVVLQVFFFRHTSVLTQAILIIGTVVNLSIWSLYRATPTDHSLRRLFRR